MQMKIAIMHYHLRQGGVTTVIRDQVAALRREAQCLVLTGEPPPDGLDAELAAVTRVVPGIGYAEGKPGTPDSRAAASAALRAMRDEWGTTADLLHVHNPTMKKNPSFPATLRRLQEAGLKLLLQIHDLAEDGRPSAYFPIEEEYPRDCHYGVINSRDRQVLIASGLRPEGVHLMWNVVRPPLEPAARPAASRGARSGTPLELIYPVRAIRRKNIGEAILLGTLMRGRLTFTLPPRNESDLARYSDWKDFVRSHDLPARFDTGLDHRLEELMGETDCALSTSLNEGFGFALLEPWTAGVAVGGRRIPHVCGDFERAGVKFPWLYETLPVSAEWLDISSFWSRWREALVSTFRSFGKDPGEPALAGAWSEMVDGGVVDFGLLDEEGQREVIARVLSDPNARRTLESREADVLNMGLADPDGHIIEQNKGVILESYGMESYTGMLCAAYQAAWNVPLRHRVDRRTLLSSFLDPRRFRILENR